MKNILPELKIDFREKEDKEGTLVDCFHEKEDKEATLVDHFRGKED